MAFRGDLNEIGLFDVFQNLEHNRLTGTLKVRHGREERWIHVREGRVRYVSLGEGIGLPMPEFLIQRGFVTRRQMDRVLKARGRSRKLLPDLLARAGALSPERYAEAFRLRVEEVLYDLLAWKQAEFEFVEGPPPRGVFDLAQKSVPLELEPSGFLMEAARREDEWRKIRKVVGGELDLFVRAGEEPGGDAEPVPAEGEAEDEVAAAVLAALDGRTPVGELERRLPYGRFEIHEALARLVGEGRARPVPAGALPDLAREALEEGEAERARVLLQRALELERNDAELRRLLAETLERLERPKDAAAQWAFLGAAALEEDRPGEALAAFEEAVRLDPTDAGLYERVFELQEQLGEAEAFERAALAFAERLESLGLNERALEVLETARRRPDMCRRRPLLERWGELMARTGHAEAGAGTFLGLARGLDEAGERFEALRILEIGLTIFPDSEDLRRLWREVESDRRNRRLLLRRRLRRRALAAAAAGLLLTVAAHEVVLRSRIAPLLRELPAAAAAGRAHRLYTLFAAERRAAPLAPSQLFLAPLVEGLAAAGAREAARARARYGPAAARRIDACLAAPPR